jgi:ribonuclease VapC
MIALDTSAIVSIVRKEAEAPIFAGLIVEQSAIVGTPTLLELHLVLNRKLEGGASDFIERFLSFGQNVPIRAVDFTFDMLRIAQDAFDRYGKGQNNPAGLNFGDCLSYAVAKFHSVPLLFKGRDFIHTDIMPAYQPSS